MLHVPDPSAATLPSLLALLPLMAAAVSRPLFAVRPRTMAPRLQPLVERGVLGGAVALAASGSRVIACDAVGWADAEARTPMQPDAMFWIASLTKPMTATAFMMLVEEGRISLDDPVERHLPAFARQMVAVERGERRVVLEPPARPVLVRDLLRHTSGLPFATAVEPERIDTLTLREAAIAYAMTPLESQPGAVFTYSNAGINVIGRLIEELTGIAFEDFLHSRLLAPLGMVDTTFWPREEQLRRLARCHRPDERGRLQVVPVPALSAPYSDFRRGPSAGGGLFSTAADVAAFARLILAGGVHAGRRLLSEESVRLMTRSHTDGMPRAYGLGWSCGPDGFGHLGSCGSELWIRPGKDLATVWLVQQQGYVGIEGDEVLRTVRAAAEEVAGG